MGLFNKISLRKPKRTSHDLSYSTKFSLDFGRLVPIMCEKVVPGDKSYHTHEFFLRMAPFVNQIFQGFQVRTEYFFVPTRLIWKNFEMWLSKGMLGDSTYVHPFCNYKAVLQRFAEQNTDNINTLFDYFNLPTLNIGEGGRIDFEPNNLSDNLPIDILPFFAYAKIFLDYYADENLDYASLIEELERDALALASDGNSFTVLSRLYARINGVNPLNTTEDMYHRFLPFKRCWPKDYFTSALPFAQRGPVVQIPLNGSGDVVVTGVGEGTNLYHGLGVKWSQSGSNVEGVLFDTGFLGITDNQQSVKDVGTNTSLSRYGVASGQPTANQNAAVTNVTRNANDNPISFKAVNINGTATITDLRTAIAIQSFLEKRARGGSRAKEQIYSSFGVRTKDYRLDRSEMLQANVNYVNIGEVFTATANESDTDIPGMAISTGKAASQSKQFKHYFEEHGYLIGLMSVFPTASYYQGIPRQFRELDQLDYYWPEFQHLGEQDVDKSELFLDDDGDTVGNFGYQPRYSQYKSRLSQIHSEFRSNLKFMTAAREFSSAPTLSNAFVQIDPVRDNLHKVFRTETPLGNSNPVYVDLYHHHKMIRPMSYFGIPRFV